MPIFDQGYQHWQGELAGHGWRWLAITRHGIRTGMQNVFLRLLLLGALGPAVMLGGGVFIWGMVEQKSPWAMNFSGGFDSLRDLRDDPTAYRITAWTILFHFFLMVEMWFIMFLVMLVGPNLISQDLRFNALPLYFSRPVRRLDYFVGKLGVIGFFLLVMTVAPALLAWILGLFFSLDFHAVIDTFWLLMGVVAFGIIVSLSAGLFILALSSLSRNSRLVAAFWGGMWFLTWSVSGILEQIHSDTLRRAAYSTQYTYYELRNMAKELEVLSNQRKFERQMADAAAKRGDDPDKVKLTPEKIEERKKQEANKIERDERIVELTDELEQFRTESKKLYDEADAQLSEDWRPLISYKDNLLRIGYALTGSQQAWETVDTLNVSLQLQPSHRSEDYFRYLHHHQLKWTTKMVPQYPWTWSALVLLALAGLSLWILRRRVTSLDQLR